MAQFYKILYDKIAHIKIIELQRMVLYLESWLILIQNKKVKQI